MKEKLAFVMVVMMVLSVMTGCEKEESKYLPDIDYSDYVTICDYKGIPATKVTFEVSETEVKQQINQEMYGYVTYEPVTDRGAMEGDFVNIDYKGVIDGVELAEYSDTARDYLLGEGFFYEEGEKAIVGMVAGDEKEINIHLNDENAKNPEEVGKTLSLTITLNEISVEHLPEYNDAFVQTNMGFDSTGAYEASVRTELEYSKKEQYKAVAISEIMNYLLENSVFDKYPQELYEECKESFEAFHTQYAKQYEMTLEEYLSLYNIDEETKEQMIIQNVNMELIIGAIAKQENIDCSEEEVEAFVQANYEKFGYGSAVEFQKGYSESQLGFEVIYEKVADLLYDSASLKTITEDEYYEQQMEMYNIEESDAMGTDETELVDEPMDMEDVIDDTEMIDENQTEPVTEEPANTGEGSSADGEEVPVG